MFAATQNIGFMAGGSMAPDPAQVALGTTGWFIAKGGSGSLPSNPNGDWGQGWPDENSSMYQNSTAIYGPLFNKMAGGLVPSELTLSLFQDSTVYVRVQDFKFSETVSGSNHTSVSTECGIALRVNGEVNLGAEYDGATQWTEHRAPMSYFTARSAGSSGGVYFPSRRFSSNGRGLSCYRYTWTAGWTGSQATSSMDILVSATFSLNLTAGVHRVGLDIWTHTAGNACPTYEGWSHSQVRAPYGTGTLYVSTLNPWGDPLSATIYTTGSITKTWPGASNVTQPRTVVVENNVVTSNTTGGSAPAPGGGWGTTSGGGFFFL